MEETDPGKEWFVTHGGKQFGPVSMDDLKYEVERGELNPRLDMVWKNGMEDWIPAGEVEGLFKRNDEAKAEEERKETAFTGYQPEIDEEEKKMIRGEWTGAGRGTYIFVCYILPFLWFAGVAFGIKFLDGRIEVPALRMAVIALCLVLLILIISATLKRFQNLGMSRLWFLGLFAPLLNLWVHYRLFACPPGYAYHKKLDGLGWVLAIIHWGSVLILVATIAFAAYTLSEAPADDPMRIAIEDFIQKIEEAQQKQ